MTAVEIIDRIAEPSPRLTARVAGLLLLVNIVMAAFALFVDAALIVRGDAAVTAANIVASEPLFRLSFAAELIAIAAYVVVVPIFCSLFRPVSREIPLVAACLGFAGDAVIAVATLTLLAPLLLLGGARYAAVFGMEQWQMLTLMLIKFNAQANSISLLFFGFHCLLISYLVFKSTFLPRLLGAPMALAGVAWLIGGFASFVSPALAAHLYPYFLAPALLGQGSLCVWLIVTGVNVQRWSEQAGTAGDLGSLRAVHA